LRSRSSKAAQDPTIKVSVPNHHLALAVNILTQLNLISKYNPAVTKVDE